MWDSILAALKSGTWLSALGGLLALGVTIGLLTTTQETSIQTVVSAAVALIAAVNAAVHTFTKAKALRATPRQ